MVIISNIRVKRSDGNLGNDDGMGSMREGGRCAIFRSMMFLSITSEIKRFIQIKKRQRDIN
jgi:hypothetical protein